MPTFSGMRLGHKTSSACDSDNVQCRAW